MTLRVALAQVDPVVGDIEGNAERVLDAWRAANARGADLVVFTELTVTGYPPEDLLLRPEFVEANLAALDRVATEHPRGTVGIVGYIGDGGWVADEADWDVTVSARDLHNAAAVIAEGRVVGVYNKLRLPNYGVFDEARYFRADDDPLVVRIAGVPVGVTICEDLWVDRGPVADAARRGARVVASLNASPYHRGKRDVRERWVTHHARRDGVHLLYVNCVGGQDEIVFDGDSMVAAPDGTIVGRGAQFAEDLVVLDLPAEPAEAPAADLPGFAGARPELPTRAEHERLDAVGEVWHALVRGTRDYVHKTGFSRGWIALSGGIDSAVTAAVAAEALGPANVTGIALPSPHSSDHSLADARTLADNLGIGFDVIAIEPAMKAFDEMLAEQFAGTAANIAEENVQARIRGLTLMALSNKHGGLVLATGNKSELAVGYATLYGDMAGAFAPLKDVTKTLVYALARHRNQRSPAVPQSTLEKAPSAELRPGQTDQDTLPPYEVLDQIVERYVEEDQGREQIVASGQDRGTVEHVMRMIDRAEYKRRQAPPGVKITERAFGKDRRLPIVNRWAG